MTAKFYMNRGGFVSIEKDGVNHFYTHSHPPYFLFPIEKPFRAAQHNNLNDDALSSNHHSSNRLEQLSVSAEEKPHIASHTRDSIVQHNKFSDLQALSAVLKVSFAVLKVCFAVLKVCFAVLKVCFAVLKVSFAVLKVSSAVLKVSFAVLKVSFAVLKVSSAILKVCFAVLKVCFAVLKVCFAVLRVSSAILQRGESVKKIV